MKTRVVILLAATLLFAGLSWGDTVTSFESATPVLSGGTVANFEGFQEFQSINTQYAGMTFSEVGSPNSPVIDNYGGNNGGNCSGYSWCYGYGASSGSGVLIGSADLNNGIPYPTIAGIIVTFATPQNNVQAFFSDTAALGNYTVEAFDSSHVMLDSITILQADTLPAGYSGGSFPAPGTFPLPGIYVGFEDNLANISSIQIGPSSASYDSFAVDDVSFGGTAAVPEPGSVLLMGVMGLVLAGGWLIGRRRAAAR